MAASDGFLSRYLAAVEAERAERVRYLDGHQPPGALARWDERFKAMVAAREEWREAYRQLD